MPGSECFFLAFAIVIVIVIESRVSRSAKRKRLRNSTAELFVGNGQLSVGVWHTAPPSRSGFDKSGFDKSGFGCMPITRLARTQSPSDRRYRSAEKDKHNRSAV